MSELTIDISSVKDLPEDSSALYKYISELYGKNFIEYYDDYIKYVIEFVGRNASILGTRNVGKHLIFTQSNENEIFDIFKIDRKIIDKIVQKSTYVKSHWKTTNTIHVIMNVLVFFFYDNKENINVSTQVAYEPYQIANFMLAMKLYSMQQRRQFKYEANDDVMAYTLDNLSNKYLITKYNSVHELVDYIAKSNFETFLGSAEKNMRTDEVLEGYISKLLTRITSSIVNIAQVYYENHKEEKKMYTENAINVYESDDGNKTELNAQTNISNSISSVSKKVIENWYLTKEIQQDIIRLTCSKLKVPYTSMYPVIQKICQEKDEAVERIFQNILSYFFVTEKLSRDMIHSYKFFNVCLSAYRISNSKDPYILEIKTDLNYLLEKYSKTYFETNRPNTKASFRLCLYTILIRTLNRLA